MPIIQNLDHNHKRSHLLNCNSFSRNDRQNNVLGLILTRLEMLEMCIMYCIYVSTALNHAQTSDALA